VPTILHSISAKQIADMQDAILLQRHKLSYAHDEVIELILTSIPKTTRYLVMAAAVGYTEKDYQRFLGTLHATGYQGDIVLFVDKVHKWENRTNVRHQLMSMEDGFVDRQSWLSYVKTQGHRYTLYREACTSRYTMCLAADFRDTYFQVNPFLSLPGGRVDLILSEEFRLSPPHFSKWNRKCIQSCWGKFSFLTQNHSLCSGIIFGSPLGWKVLTTKMDVQFETKRNTKCKLIDQGVLNYLFFTKQLHPLNILVQPRGEGIANNLGVIRPRSSIKRLLNERGQVVNKDGSLSPIVHQYDRVRKYWRPFPRAMCDKFQAMRGGIREELVALLNATHRAFERQHIDYSITTGTLLGYARHNGFVPWDDDVDVMIHSRDFQKVILAFEQNPTFCVAIRSRKIQKIYRCNGGEKVISPLDGLQNWTFPFVDVFSMKSSKRFRDKYLFPTEIRRFEGIKVRVPPQNNIGNYLSLNYKTDDYMIKCRSAVFDHTIDMKHVSSQETYLCSEIMKTCYAKPL